MFWSEVENNPKHRVKECPGVHFFNQDEDLNDTLDIFDEILKENYEDSINESIDEHFELQLLSFTRKGGKQWWALCSTLFRKLKP